jgi:hypothetical protein
MGDEGKILACPTCGRPMEKGKVVGRPPGVKFKYSVGFLGDLTGIQLTTGFFNHSVAAWRCNECGTVLIPPQQSDE